MRYLTAALRIILCLIVSPAFLLTSCSDSSGGSGQTPYQRADAARGGRLYDDFWAVTATLPPETLPAEGSRTEASGEVARRCAECHGYDYKGKSSGENAAPTGGLLSLSSRTPDSLRDSLADAAGEHDFTPFLSDEDIWDLVRFLKEGVIDTELFFLQGSSFADGEAAEGRRLYEAPEGEGGCLSCHGEKGERITDGSTGENLAAAAQDAPRRILHRLRSGVPGGGGAVVVHRPDDLGDDLGPVVDLLTYLQSLIVPEGYGTASAERGGLLYDTWWLAAGLDAPAGRHPLYPASGSLAQSGGGETHRCAVCHGFDYRGRFGTGDPSVGAPSLFDTGDIGVAAHFAALARPLANHDFSGVLGEGELWDLVKFLREGKSPADRHVDPLTKAALGDAEAGGLLYAGSEEAEGCVGCHGTDGRKTPPGSEEKAANLGAVAADEPWRFLHRLRHGQPGTAFGGAAEYGLGEEELGDLLAYAQTLSPALFTEGDAARGGRLYASWWAEKDVQPPAEEFQLYTELSPFHDLEARETHSCAVSHGYDYAGKKGVYGENGGNAVGPGLFKASEKTPTELVASLTDEKKDHDFSASLDEEDLWDLAAFVKDGLASVGGLLDPFWSVFSGDAAKGGRLYSGEGRCYFCHGPDGRALPLGEERRTLGESIRRDPLRALHIARFGMAGSAMTKSSLTVQELADLLTYAQGLP